MMHRVLAALVLALLSGSAWGQGCTYYGGYPWRQGGCLVANDINAAIDSRNPLLNLAPVKGRWVNGFDNGVPQTAQPSFGDLGGALVPGQIPPASAGTLGGVFSYSSPGSQFLFSLDSNGRFASRQPSFLDIAGIIAPTQLPAPTATNLGGVKSKPAVATQFFTALDTTGAFATGTVDTLADPLLSTHKVSTAPTNAATTSFATVAGLTFPLQAGKAYHCSGHLTVTAAPAAGGIKVTLAAAAGLLTASSMSMTGASFNGATTAARSTATTLGTAIGAITGTVTDVDIAAGIVVNAAGTLAVQFAQNAASGTTTVGALSTFSCVRTN
jgi:hypothetical protein